jgi:multiple sugar transport system ATP-binding protein
MAEIELDNVSKYYANTRAVRNTSFSIHDGEFFILVGPSGCGKSTLLNLITGLETVSEGEIRVDGQRVNDLDPRERNMAMVFQSYALYPHMSVRDNMAFPLKLAKLSAKEIDRRVTRAADILELSAILDRKPRALSGGQRQRVAMGRAIVRDPKVFLLDEPLSNLDARLRVQMRTEIARLQQQLGTTTLYVTHDQTEAMTLGDRIAVLNDGEVMQIGTPRDLYDNPANRFVAGFIGSPAMNFLPARLTANQLQLPLGSFAVPEHLRGCVESAERPLIAGFRPEHLRVAREGVDAPTGLQFSAKAGVVEWLGAALFVYFDVGNAGFDGIALSANRGPLVVASIDPAIGVSEGDTLQLQLPSRHMHIFDAESGENLTLSKRHSNLGQS